MLICTPLTALCCSPQILLIITALVVAAAFTGLGIKWAEEWRSARISLQVSWLVTRDCPAVLLWRLVGTRCRMVPGLPSMAVWAKPCPSLLCAVLPGAAAVRVGGLEGDLVLFSLALWLFQWCWL